MAATLIAIFLIPVTYYVIECFAAKRQRARAARRPRWRESDRDCDVIVRMIVFDPRHHEAASLGGEHRGSLSRTHCDLRDIDDAASKIPVQGARKLEKMTGL